MRKFGIDIFTIANAKVPAVVARYTHHLVAK
jgi:hypothetical protein